MSSALTNIVLVQYFPGAEEYIVYREGSEAELYRGGAAITDQDYYIYAQECIAAGCTCESTFHVATGKAADARYVVCRQVIYCKALAQGASANAVLTGAKGVAAGVLSTVVNTVNGAQSIKRDATLIQSSISWVKWCPALYELSVCAGKLPIPKVHRIHDLHDAPAEVIGFIRTCFARKFIALSRSYQRPIQDGKAQRITLVTEYYFSISKPNKDFRGRDVVPVTKEDMLTLGLIRPTT